MFQTQREPINEESREGQYGKQCGQKKILVMVNYIRVYLVKYCIIILLRMQQDLNKFEDIDENHQQGYQVDPKVSNLPNCLTFQHRSTMSTPIAVDIEHLLHDPFDTSLDQEMHTENINALFEASLKYLEDSLTGPFDKTLGFKDTDIYRELPFEQTGSNEYELLVNQNGIFNAFERTAFKCHLQEEGALIGFIKQLIPVFGTTVSQELTYIISQVLQHKLGEYRKWRQTNELKLPKIGCFQMFDDDCLQPLEMNCPVFEDLNTEELKDLSTQDIEEIAKKVTFSRQICHINLRNVKAQTSSNFTSKLIEFVRAISKITFYTVAGVSDPDARTIPSELSREVSFAEMPEGLSRAPSRPFVPCDDDEPRDFLSKKRKFQ